MTVRNTAIAIIATGLLLLCVSIVFVLELYRPSAQQGATAAEPLIQALEHYRADQGQYPQELHELEPHYISHLPTPGLSNDFQYAACSTENIFLLNFHPRGSHPLHAKWYGYSSVTKQWKFSASVPAYLYETPCFGY